MNKRLCRKPIPSPGKSPAESGKAARSFSLCRKLLRGAKAKKLILRACALALFFFALSSSASSCAKSERAKLFGETYEPLFDTVCAFYMATDEKARFDECSSALHKLLARLNGLFDVYNDYSEPNLKSVNDAAGIEPVRVDREILEMLSFARSYAEKTPAFDPVFGAVTLLWKKASEEKAPPKEALLKEAAKHTGISLLQIDEEKGEVFLTDPEARIDAGAYAKGYAAARAASLLADMGADNYLLSLGGSVTAKGVNASGGLWTTAVRDPANRSGTVASYALDGLSAVTSGNYERFFYCGGVRYHHIIDPETLFPAARAANASVTVFSKDPACADILSTALFILPEDEARALLENQNASALIVKESGEKIAIGRLPDEVNDQSARNTALDIAVVAVLALSLLAAGLWAALQGRKAARPEEAQSASKENSGFAPWKKRDLFLILALTVLSAAALITFFAVKGKKAENKAAIVRVDGRAVAVLPLDRDVLYEAETPYGRNLIAVKDGRVYVASSDCPGQDCVHAGALDGKSFPSVIACLPHRLTVSVEEEMQADL